jgi:hypothetical protein
MSFVYCVANGLKPDREQPSEEFRFDTTEGDLYRCRGASTIPLARRGESLFCRVNIQVRGQSGL